MNKELINQLRELLKKDFLRDFSDEEAFVIARTLLEAFELLIKHDQTHETR